MFKKMIGGAGWGEHVRGHTKSGIKKIKEFCVEYGLVRGVNASFNKFVVWLRDEGIEIPVSKLLENNENIQKVIDYMDDGIPINIRIENRSKSSRSSRNNRAARRSIRSAKVQESSSSTRTKKRNNPAPLNNQEDLECPICLSEITGETCYVCKSNHVFCCDCIKKVKESSGCPLCRRKFCRNYKTRRNNKSSC